VAGGVLWCSTGRPPPATAEWSGNRTNYEHDSIRRKRLSTRDLCDNHMCKCRPRRGLRTVMSPRTRLAAPLAGRAGKF
jgi:hypothetical protein